MARVLWILGFALTFLLFGGVAIGVAIRMVSHRHFTVNGILFLTLSAFAIRGLWDGYRVIVLKRTDQ